MTPGSSAIAVATGVTFAFPEQHSSRIKPDTRGVWQEALEEVHPLLFPLCVFLARSSWRGLTIFYS